MNDEHLCCFVAIHNFQGHIVAFDDQGLAWIAMSPTFHGAQKMQQGPVPTHNGFSHWQRAPKYDHPNHVQKEEEPAIVSSTMRAHLEKLEANGDGQIFAQFDTVNNRFEIVMPIEDATKISELLGAPLMITISIADGDR